MTFDFLLNRLFNKEGLWENITEWQMVCRDVHVSKATEIVLVAQGQ